MRLRPLLARCCIAGLTVVTVVALAPGCGGGGGGPVTVTITGTVAHGGTLAGIAGATVAVGTNSTVTGAGGAFALGGVATGAATITVTAAGYRTGSFAFTVPVGGGATGTLYLAPTHVAGTGDVSGTVQDGSVPVANASLAVGAVTAKSRADGSYILYNVPAGAQTILAESADKAKTGFKTVTVPADGILTGQIILVTSGPPPPPPL